MSKINLESIRPWIVKRITELLNFEDEVVCDYIFNQLEERVSLLTFFVVNTEFIIEASLVVVKTRSGFKYYHGLPPIAE